MIEKLLNKYLSRFIDICFFGNYLLLVFDIISLTTFVIDIIAIIYIYILVKEKKQTDKKGLIFNFKYEIGEVTDLGKVESRYYKEWINRNGGKCNGDFYVMQDGKSYNEFLINN